VERIEDVVAEPGDPASRADQGGPGRRLVIEERITELLDIEALLADANADAPASPAP
jgi:hypothetical protein